MKMNGRQFVRKDVRDPRDVMWDEVDKFFLHHNVGEIEDLDNVSSVVVKELLAKIAHIVGHV